jgi:DNA-binding phage protein
MSMTRLELTNHTARVLVRQGMADHRDQRPAALVTVSQFVAHQRAAAPIARSTGLDRKTIRSFVAAVANDSNAV